MSLSRRGLLGLAAAAPAAAASAGPLGLTGWISSLLRGIGISSGASGLAGSLSGATFIPQTTIVAGAIRASSIRVESIGIPKLGLFGPDGGGSGSPGVFSQPRRFRPVVATNIPRLREVSGEGRRRLVWEGGIVEVNPENAYGSFTLPFSGLYYVESGSREVDGTQEVALTLESDEGGPRLVAVPRSEVPSLADRCVVSVWSPDSLGLDAVVHGYCQEWPGRPEVGTPYGVTAGSLLTVPPSLGA